MTYTSVIVVSYRPGVWLSDCLASVAGVADEVVVVDNASPGREASSVALRYGARVVRTHRNLGFAGGVAAGLAEASGEIIGVLNDDARADERWLSSAADVLADPTVAAVTPKVLLSEPFIEVRLDEEAWFAPGDPRPLGRQVRSLCVDGREVLGSAVGGGIHDLETGGDDRWRWTAGTKPFYVPAGVVSTASDTAGSGTYAAEVVVNGESAVTGPLVRLVNHAGSFLRSHGIAGEYGFGAPDDGRFDTPAERFGFSGTAPVFRAEVLRRIGGFSQPFFAYNEDTDWCLRARLGGLRVMYDPGGTVVHRLSATSGGTGAAFVRRLSQRNALLCLLRNAPLGVARREVEQRLRRGWRDQVAREVALRLPWALASRASLSRRWVGDPAQVWQAWADRDTTWDDSPAGAAARWA